MFVSCTRSRIKEEENANKRQRKEGGRDVALKDGRRGGGRGKEGGFTRVPGIGIRIRICDGMRGGEWYLNEI